MRRLPALSALLRVFRCSLLSISRVQSSPHAMASLAPFAGGVE
jgi:hypothetical protein